MNFQNINKAQYLEMIKDPNVLAIDVRTEEECEIFEYPNSITGYCYNSGQFHDKMDEIPRDKKIILLCRSGARSAHACMLLAEAGFENVYNLEGGLIAWEKVH